MTKDNQNYGSVERTPANLYNILNPTNTDIPWEDKYQILLDFTKWAKDQSCDIHRDDCLACVALEVLKKIGEDK